MPRRVGLSWRRVTWAVTIAIGLAVLLAACSPGGVTEAQYPEPMGNVNDYVGVLSKRDKEKLDALIASVLEDTGVTFAVAIVEDTGGESLEMYAANLYEKWGVGQKDGDLGLLVLVTMKERGLRVEVGYGLEPVITDARAGECADKMVPYFREGKYGDGIYAGLLHAAQYIAKDKGIALGIRPPEDATEPEEGPVVSFPWTALLGIALVTGGVGLLLSRFAGPRCPRCRSRLVTTERVVHQATATTSGLVERTLICPVCGFTRKEMRKTRSMPGIYGPSGRGPTIGGGPFFGGWGRGGGFSGPRGFGGGRSGGGGASRRW